MWKNILKMGMRVVLVVISVFVILITTRAFAAEASGNNIISQVNQKGSSVYYRQNNTWIEIVGEDDPIEIAMGTRLKFQVLWEMEDIQTKQIKAGDYFDFKLPSTHFNFEVSDTVNLVDDHNVVIGTFRIITGDTAYIRIVINEQGASKDYIRSAFVTAYGYASRTKSEDELITVGTEDLPPFIIGEGESGSGEMIGMGDLRKNGWQISNRSEAYFELYVNYEEMISAYKKAPFNKKVNVSLIDILPEGISFTSKSKVSIMSLAFYATDKGTMSDLPIAESQYLFIQNQLEFVETSG